MNPHRAKLQYLRTENKKWPAELRELTRDEFPALSLLRPSSCPVRVWRSCDFLVQLYTHESCPRLTFNRTDILPSGRWRDRITWDELQRLKHEAGFGAYQAVEIYPPDRHVVDDANLRHLWLINPPLGFAWTRDNAHSPVQHAAVQETVPLVRPPLIHPD